MAAAASISADKRDTNFIRQIVEADLAEGKHKAVRTRFPPEPNGFLHLGHAKSICLNFGLANHFGGECNLRFDDTNPTRENQRYIDSIIEDVRWLGGRWGDNLFYASDYFDRLYEFAENLIKKNLAYVDDQNEEQLRASRGDLFTPGVDSPFRARSVEENLTLFRSMRDGKFKEGECVLRAKIDMAHGNLHMRDPLIYRIRYHDHPRTGSKWCIYPMYDFAHGQSDSLERITHSICTLEFEDHRPLYEWFQEQLDIPRTRQIEFARLNVTHVPMSKRKLVSLVEEGFVNDWDDPRMPTIAGMRRRGYPAAALHDFCDRIGVAKRDNVMPYELIERCVRDALHGVAVRRNVVAKPVKVIIDNWPEEGAAHPASPAETAACAEPAGGGTPAASPSSFVEYIDCANHPTDASFGTRKMAFSRELYIDRSDVLAEVPPPELKFHRLYPGNEVRLRYAYWIKCVSVEKGADGQIEVVHCTYDPATKGGAAPPDGRKVKGTLHWVSAVDSVRVTLNMYDHLFLKEDPDEGLTPDQTWRDAVNEKSLVVIENAVAEPDLLDAAHPWKSGGKYFQFERLGFFVRDLEHSKPSSEVKTSLQPRFNLTVGLTDSFAAQTNEKSKEAQLKEQAKLAREKAAAERAKKKAEREQREAKKAAEKAAKAKELDKSS